MPAPFIRSVNVKNEGKKEEAQFYWFCPTDEGLSHMMAVAIYRTGTTDLSHSCKPASLWSPAVISYQQMSEAKVKQKHENQTKSGAWLWHNSRNAELELKSDGESGEHERTALSSSQPMGKDGNERVTEWGGAEKHVAR